MNFQHKELAAGRWAQMSIAEQLANIGSEVSRALNWQKKGNEQYSKNAAIRVLELLDLSLGSTQSFPQLKELARVREAWVDYFFGDNQFASSELLWRKYFDHFNYLIRRKT